MPYKFNHCAATNFPEPKHCVTNQPEYESAYVRRKGLTVWFTEEAISGWRAAPTGKISGELVGTDHE